VPRKRISLTLRLDDEPARGRRPEQTERTQRPGGDGQAQGRPRTDGQRGNGQRGNGQRGNGQARDDRRSGRSDTPANGAMAEALRRAGFTG
jgi:uncharacterized protein